MKPDYEFDYEKYDADPAENTAAGKIFAIGHRLLERTLPPGDYPRVIEVGAGSGKHVKYLNPTFDEYYATDRNPLMLERMKSEGTASNVLFRDVDATKIDFESNSFDRLIACHVLEHLPSPHLVLREWHRVIKPGGVMSLLLPTDPGLAWRLARVFARRSAIARGLPYDYVMAREHINPINNLVAMIRYYFNDHVEAWWPTRLPSMDCNLFYVCHIKKHSTNRQS